VAPESYSTTSQIIPRCSSKQGGATLNAMHPPVQQGMGKRSSVEFYEVGVKIDN